MVPHEDEERIIVEQFDNVSEHTIHLFQFGLHDRVVGTYAMTDVVYAQEMPNYEVPWFGFVTKKREDVFYDAVVHCV